MDLGVEYEMDWMDRRMDGCIGCMVWSGRIYAMKRIDECMKTSFV